MSNLVETTCHAVPQEPVLRPDATLASSQIGSECDLLIGPDGTVLVHNLTPAMATVLNLINPQDAALRLRSDVACESEVPGIAARKA